MLRKKQRERSNKKRPSHKLNNVSFRKPKIKNHRKINKIEAYRYLQQNILK